MTFRIIMPTTRDRISCRIFSILSLIFFDRPFFSEVDGTADEVQHDNINGGGRGKYRRCNSDSYRVRKDHERLQENHSLDVHAGCGLDVNG